jgi:hypothetical protein
MFPATAGPDSARTTLHVNVASIAIRERKELGFIYDSSV